MTDRLKNLIRFFIPQKISRDFMITWQRGFGIQWGNLRRITPISRVFGFDRGKPIDRYYIETFLQKNQCTIKGCVMEIGDSTYTRKFGDERVKCSEVLHAVEGNTEATFVGDLATGEGIPKDKFDCIILTQTFPFIFDVRAALVHTYEALKPGGCLLATFSGISQISRYDMDRWGDYWRFTDASARRLFGDVFGAENISVESHGNVLVACAFLHGLAVEELTQKEMDYNDPDYQVIITVRAIKTGTVE